MWICLNNAFLSIVEPDSIDVLVANQSDGGDLLLVRARRKGDIESVFPRAVVTTVPGRDYQFRAYIQRDKVGEAIALKVTGITYPNFKNSVKDRTLHDAYATVWGVMAQEQAIPPYETAPRKRTRFAVNPRSPYVNG